MSDEVTKAAAMLGKLGGKSTSAAKVAAAKRNGHLGGRPRKVQMVDPATIVRAMRRKDRAKV